MYLFFDTETSGLPKNWNAPASNLSNWPRLVQLAWLEFDADGNKTFGTTHIIKPVGFRIAKAAADVHGISTEYAMENGEDLLPLLGNFYDAIERNQYLVAHNVNFDEKIMGAELLRNDIPNIIEQKERICTMKSTTEVCKIPGRYGYKWPKLIELHRFLFNEGFEGEHDALADVEACARCFFELKKQGLFK